MSRPCKIFIVDDSTMYSNFMRKILASKLDNCEIRCFHEPEKTWEALGQDTPDLVILDYNMPEMNGDDWMVKLSETCMISKLSVMMVTGQNPNDDFEFGMYSLGVEEILYKPVKAHALVEKVHEVLAEASSAKS